MPAADGVQCCTSILEHLKTFTRCKREHSAYHWTFKASSPNPVPQCKLAVAATQWSTAALGCVASLINLQSTTAEQRRLMPSFRAATLAAWPHPEGACLACGGTNVICHAHICRLHLSSTCLVDFQCLQIPSKTLQPTLQTSSLQPLHAHGAHTHNLYAHFPHLHTCPENGDDLEVSLLKHNRLTAPKQSVSHHHPRRSTANTCPAVKAKVAISTQYYLEATSHTCAVSTSCKDAD
jgi:hypothetical protein